VKKESSHPPILIAISWQALNRALSGDPRTRLCDCTVVILFAGFFVEANLNDIVQRLGRKRDMLAFLQRPYPGLQDKLVSPKPIDLVDQFEANGFELDVRVISQKAMAMVSGSGPGTFVFGRPLAGGCVIAHMLMADPKSPKNVELAIRAAGIVRKSLPEGSCM